MSETIELSNGVFLRNVVNMGHARRKQLLVDMIATIATISDKAADREESVVFSESVELPEFPANAQEITILQLITHGKEAACRGEFILAEGHTIPFALFVNFKSAGKDEIVGLQFFG